jgi:NAD(P)-dependent dehydrogenase (short-subunit alcohol dehydrogenase family)
VAKPADLDKLYGAVAEKFGKIDVLFVNAGVAKFAPLTAVDEAHFDEMFDINTRGGVFHHPEGGTALEYRSVDHPEYERRRCERETEWNGVCGDEGGAAVVCAIGGGGVGGARDPGEHGGARTD